MPTVEILPVEKLTSGRDFMRCPPYRAVLSAQTCVARQDVVAVQSGQDTRKPLSDRLNGDYRHCRDCPIGRAVRDRLGGGDPP